MVVFFRIDDRLIHGQVATTWSRHINPDLMMVANDEVAENNMLTSLQRIAAPKDITVQVCNIISAINLLNTILTTKKVFLIVKSMGDACAIARNVKVNEINIGNIGFKQNTINLVRRIFVSKEDLNQMSEIVNCGIKVYAQMLPNESIVTISKELITEKLVSN